MVGDNVNSGIWEGECKRDSAAEKGFGRKHFRENAFFRGKGIPSPRGMPFFSVFRGFGGVFRIAKSHRIPKRRTLWRALETKDSVYCQRGLGRALPKRFRITPKKNRDFKNLLTLF
jgi:hypothetical protein